MDLLHVRRDDDKPQADRVPGALLALPRHHVPDLEVALPGAAKNLEALKRQASRSRERPRPAGRRGASCSTRAAGAAPTGALVNPARIRRGSTDQGLWRGRSALNFAIRSTATFC